MKSAHLPGSSVPTRSAMPIAAAGDCHGLANDRDTIVFDTDHAIADDVTVQRVEHATADDVQRTHRRLLQ